MLRESLKDAHGLGLGVQGLGFRNQGLGIREAHRTIWTVQGPGFEGFVPMFQGFEHHSGFFLVFQGFAPQSGRFSPGTST